MPRVLSFCPLRPWASNASIATFKGSRSTENKKNSHWYTECFNGYILYSKAGEVHLKYLNQLVTDSSICTYNKRHR